ncbi:nidogen isoform X4 [Rhodnius prolixus]|uniref:nidogen isoform X4 n=1 Tax=Rhodnius prolixus TaxID=13249 RepID=UPI003D18B43B
MAATNLYLYNFSIFHQKIILCLLLFVSPPGFALPLSEFYPYGSPLDNSLEQGDDVSTEVLLSVPVKFFGDSYDTIFVNTNGLLSFVYEASYFSNIEFPLQYPVIAPLYSNVDTTGKGKVYYRETNDSSLLQRSTHNILNLYPNLPQKYEAKSLFISTWDHVGYHEGGKDKLNTFQAVISTDGEESFAEILYADGGIQWMQATNKYGLPEAKAQAGIVAPEGKFYTLRGSGTDQVINLDKWTNADRPGLFLFRIGNIDDTGNVEAPPNSYGDYKHREPRTCFEGGTNCHSNAECYEEPEGYCCRCQPSYFGNGRSCLERETARRIFGKLKLNINSVSLEDLDFHGYIITKDGKIYIAVNNLPESVGYVLQLLFTLDSFVGWLFASPKGNAKNGYMLSGGVVNHTADITFDDYYRVNIKQKYTGLNLFDHIRMEAEVHGTLPNIPRDIQIDMPDFNELYTRTGTEEYRSNSRHEIKLGNGEVHTMAVDQTINFFEHCRAAEEDMPTIKMESVKNYINYEKDQSILRFASFNKIFRGSEKSDDPCIEGRKECVANSSCLVEGDGYRCVCNSGFMQLNNNVYSDSQTDFGCTDINECVDGTNFCHADAICVNEIGSYYCQCKPGFTGNGKYCESFHEEPGTPENAICHNPDDYSTCSCRQGYQMVGASTPAGFSCEDIDECSDYPCSEGADCINLPGNHTCRCKDGYKQDEYGYCYRAEPCSLIVCPEDSVCETRDGTAYCSCPSGYSGTPPNCSPDYAENDCRSLNCPEGTRCITEYEQAPRCVCLSGYGTYPDCLPVRTDACSSDLDCPDYSRCTVQLDRNACICLPGYERNGLSCVPTAASYETIYRTCLRNSCWCPPGYYERDDICIRHYDSTIGHGTLTTQNPWEDTCSEQCHHNAQCIYVPNEQSYKCMCQAGYEGDGLECRIMDLSCNESADYCHYNATCIHDDKSDRYICICKDGFEGDGTTCYPIVGPCDSLHCHPDAQCVFMHEEQQYRCICPSGFEGDGYICQLVEFNRECEQDRDCGPNAHCYYNIYNSRYNCACIYGYEKNAKGVCELEEQKYVCSTCHENAVCVQRYGQHECICNEGYEGDGLECTEKILGCDVLGGCSQYADCLYSTSVSRYVCNCKEGYEGNGTHCESVVTCYELPDLCSPDATCTYAHGKVICECNDGFYGNGTFCKEARKQEEEYLLVNKGRTILQVPFSPTNRGRPIHINENQTAIGIAFDCVDGRVYWSDITNLQVKSSKYDGTDFKVFMDKGIQSPEGLAIDWLNREVYWTDSGYDKIVAVNLDTKEVRTVASENLVNPRGIAVNPYRRKVYWSDWNREAPKIEWANLDGTDRQIIAQAPSIKLPNSLAIDWSTEELCWADAGTKTIECLNVEANRLRTIVKNCSYPYGLAITDNMYFWTDWNTLKLESSTKEKPNEVKSIDLPLGGHDKLYGVVAITSCP